MENLNKLADKIEKIFKPFPHFPANWRKGLSGAMWWLVLIATILSLIACACIIIPLIFLGVLTVGSSIDSNGAVVLAGFTVWIVLVPTILLLGMAIVQMWAIKPLKNKERKGWNIVYVLSLLGLVVSILSIFGGNFAGWLSGILWSVLWIYVWFELRDSFKEASIKATAVKTAKVAKKKK